jgi:hypothetical protein
VGLGRRTSPASRRKFLRSNTQLKSLNYQCLRSNTQLKSLNDQAHRTQYEDGAGGSADKLIGREQLFFTSTELQTRLGQKFCDETALLSLLLGHGLVRRVRTIFIEVIPLGGDSFKVTLNASNSTVGEAKTEISRVQGTTEARQVLYKVAERADGLAVREDDADPELLEDDSMLLGDGENGDNGGEGVEIC